MKRDVFPLGEVLRDPEKFLSLGGFLFADMSGGISASTLVVIVPDFDPALEDDFVTLDDHRGRKFEDFLFIDDLLQIRENLGQQIERVDFETMVSATNYFYEFDAFMEVDGLSESPE